MPRIIRPEFIASVGTLFDSHTKFFDELCIKSLMPGNCLDLNDFEEFRDVTCIPSSFKISFDDGASIEKLVLPRGVSSIGPEAFSGACIPYVVWPDACHHIPTSAFENSCLKRLDNIAHVKSMGDYVFKGSDIESFVIPERIINIPVDTFRNCKKLTSVVGLERIRRFGNQCFDSCVSLKDIPPLDSATAILAAAFYGTGIECVDLSKSACIRICNAAFADSKLKTFIPGYFPIDMCSNIFCGTPYEENNK